MISSQMYLIVKTEFNECHINLLTVNEIIIILSNKYNQLCFYNIVICFHHIRNAQYGFSYVYFNHAVYISLQYSLFFI